MGVIAPIYGNQSNSQPTITPSSGGGNGVIAPIYDPNSPVRVTVQQSQNNQVKTSSPNIIQEAENVGGNILSGIGHAISPIFSGISKVAAPVTSAVGQDIHTIGQDIGNLRFPNGTTLSDTYSQAMQDLSHGLVAPAYAPAQEQQPGNLNQLTQEVKKNAISDPLQRFGNDVADTLMSTLQGATNGIFKNPIQNLSPEAHIIKPIAETAGQLYSLDRLGTGIEGLLGKTPIAALENDKFLKFIPSILKNVGSFSIYGQLDPQTKDRMRQFVSDAEQGTLLSTLGLIGKARYSIPLAFGGGFGLAKLNGLDNGHALASGIIFAALEATNKIPGLFESTFKNGSREFTPQEARDYIMNSPYKNTDLGKQVMKDSFSAEQEGKNIKMNMTAAKQGVGAKLFKMNGSFEGGTPQGTSVSYSLVDPSVAQPETLPASATPPTTGEEAPTQPIPNEPNAPQAETSSSTAPSTLVDRQVEQQAQQYVSENYDQAKQDYMDRIQQEFGTKNVVSADEGKYIFPGYNGANAPDYHEAASSLAKAIYNEWLGERQGQGNNTVLFTSGGTGVGKTTALANAGTNLTEYPIVYDTNLTGSNAAGKIQRALDNGYKVEITFVQRDPFTSFEKGVIPRVRSKNRIVTLSEHIARHQQALDNLLKLKEQFGDKISTNFIDNTGGQGEAKLVSFDKLPKYDYNYIGDKTKYEQIVRDALEANRNNGTKGLTEKEARRILEVPNQSENAVDGRQPQPQHESAVASLQKQAANLPKTTSSVKIQEALDHLAEDAKQDPIMEEANASLIHSKDFADFSKTVEALGRFDKEFRQLHNDIADGKITASDYESFTQQLRKSLSGSTQSENSNSSQASNQSHSLTANHEGHTGEQGERKPATTETNNTESVNARGNGERQRTEVNEASRASRNGNSVKAPHTDKYHISRYSTTGKQEFVEATDPHKVVIEPGLDTFVSKSNVQDVSKPWVVTEAKTGMAMSHGFRTQAEAVADTKKIIAEMRASKGDNAIQEYINKATDTYGMTPRYQSEEAVSERTAGTQALPEIAKPRDTSVRLGSGFDPGVDKFIDEDVKEAAQIATTKAKQIVKIINFVKDGFINIVEPAKVVEIKHGGQAYASVIKAIHTPEAEELSFNTQKSQIFDKNFENLEKFFSRFSQDDLKTFNLTRGEAETETAQAIQKAAREAVNPILQDPKIMQAITDVSDYVYNWGRANGVELNYFEDYFYGNYKAGDDGQSVENFLDYWKSTDRYTKEKKLPTIADAEAFGLELKTQNPITNLRQEMNAMAKRVGLLRLKNDNEAQGVGYMVSRENATEQQLQTWKKVQDPVFKGYLFAPEYAKFVNNLIETNKISSNPLLKGLRQTSFSLQQIKFFGSIFHLRNIAQAAISDNAAGVVNPKGYWEVVKSLKPVNKSDPAYKEYLNLGGGHSYSIESAAEGQMTKAIDRLSRGNVIGGFLRLPLGVSEIRFIPGSPGNIKWMFEDYIPAVKFTKYQQHVSSQQQKLKRPLTDAEKIRIIKDNNNFYGEMNERLFGRSGTVTSALRLLFSAPSYGEGNFRAIFRTIPEKGHGRATQFIYSTLLTSLVLSAIGTYFLSGKWPDAPKTANDVRDLFKVKTNLKDGNGDTVYFDMLGYGADYWSILGNLLTGQAGKIPGALTSRFAGMVASGAKVTTDLATLAEGNMVYDYKGQPMFLRTDDFTTKLSKFLQTEGVTISPISSNTFVSTKAKGTNWLSSALVAAAGLRPTTSEKVKTTKAAVQDLYSLQDAKKSAQTKFNKLYNENPQEAIKQAKQFNADQLAKLRHIVHSEGSPTVNVSKIKQNYLITKLYKGAPKEGSTINNLLQRQ